MKLNPLKAMLSMAEDDGQIKFDDDLFAPIVEKLRITDTEIENNPDGSMEYLTQGISEPMFCVSVIAVLANEIINILFEQDIDQIVETIVMPAIPIGDEDKGIPSVIQTSSDIFWNSPAMIGLGVRVTHTIVSGAFTFLVCSSAKLGGEAAERVHRRVERGDDPTVIAKEENITMQDEILICYQPCVLSSPSVYTTIPIHRDADQWIRPSIDGLSVSNISPLTYAGKNMADRVRQIICGMIGVEFEEDVYPDVGGRGELITYV